MNIKVGDIVTFRPEIMKEAKINNVYYGVTYETLCLLNKGASVSAIESGTYSLMCKELKFAYRFEEKDLIKDDMKEKLEAILG
jgi:hypothetical protein